MDSLAGRNDFKRLRLFGVTGRCRQISVVLSVTPEDSRLRVGFAIPKAVGNAVQRNRCRRRLRHVLCEAVGVENGLVLIRVHETFDGLSRDDLVAVMRSAAERALAKQ